MTGVMPWRVAIGKELRALFPLWLALAIALIVLALRKDGAGLAWAIYVVGAVALGAMSLGQEYVHGTLSPWLALPVRRWQLLAAKLAALATFLIPLAVLGTLDLIAANDFRLPGSFRLAWPAIGLPVLYALVVAPGLTMVARGPLGGVAFTLAIPLVALLALLVTEPLDVYVRPSFWTLMSVIAVAGAVLGARAFMQLEALETHRDVDLPKLFGASRAQTRSRLHPLWALVTKELRLQQLTVLMAALSFTALLLARWYHGLAPKGNLDLTYPLSMVHLALVPILAGALASAEERRLGTLEWQVLQPVATWKQWLIKAMVVVMLSVIVSLVPLALVHGSDRHLMRDFPLDQAMVIVASLAVATLWVSSISTSGIRAIIMAIPILAVLATVMTFLPQVNSSAWSTAGGFVANWLRTSMESLVTRWEPAGFSSRTERLILSVRGGFAFIALVGLVAAVLRFGLLNHRSAERGAWRVGRQVAMFFVYVIVVQIVFTGVGALYAAGFSRFTPEERRAFSESMVRRARWQHELDVLTKGFDGRVGVCAGDSNFSEACVRDNQLFPMQSVMKLPVAVSALEAVDAGTWRLDDEVVVRKQDLSVFVQPIAKLVGPTGFKTTIGDLVRRAIVDSDSAATDMLIAKLSGTQAVQLTLNRKATSAVRVDRDEKHLQTETNGLDWRDEYLDPPTLDRAIKAVPEARRDAAFQAYLHDRRDTSTPRGMTYLLEKLAAGRLLSPSSTQFLLDTLKQTTTFPDRLKAGVPDGWTIGHKTGTSGTWRGVTAAFNDVGILTGPNGETISIAVFITDSKASDKDMAKLMADIARAIVTKY